MDGGNLSVARALPIDASLIGDVLLRLRRDTRGSAAGMTLGGRGAAEIEVDFRPVEASAAGPAWVSAARLWDPEVVAVVHAVVELTAVSNDECELTIRPHAPLTPWWSARLPALEELTQAVVDEFAEELLWHATRDDVAGRQSF